jgi:uncharacterized protein (TIGR02145 family)
MKNIIIIAALFLLILSINLFNSCKKDKESTSVSDVDGNIYKIVTIGNQTWMAENLKTTKYRNGEQIQNVTDAAQWSYLTTAAYCNYSNNVSNANSYGSLYNWFAVKDSRNIAPLGWHVPTDSEWTILINFLGGDSIAGAKLKETGLTHWSSPNTGATNETGFTSLPSGFRNDSGDFVSQGLYGLWWSSTEAGGNIAWYRGMHFDGTDAFRNNYYKPNGYSVRCIKDN